jgi:hypothetical protein
MSSNAQSDKPAGTRLRSQEQSKMVESSSGQESVAGFASPSDQLLRPARALIGWLAEDLALRLLNAGRADAISSDEQRATVAAARGAVANRPEGVDQKRLVQDIPSGKLEAHVERLQQSGAASAYFSEGYRVALVDLPRVCAFQSTVFTDSAEERAGGIDPDDVEHLATVTLPTDWNIEQQAQLDETRHLWMLISRNPNLKVVGHFAGPVGPNNIQGFGFVVTVMPSFLQVASYQGRYFLRDGYHRALGLLGIGARFVPAFVREFTSIEQLVPQGMLPQEAYLGPRPPTLTDYADNQVSAQIQLPASQKMVVVQALELSPRG